MCEPIRVDPELRDLVPGYLTRRREDVVALREALAEDDLATVALRGHKMKGSGAGYGFDRISEIGARLERAAQSGDADEARTRVDELESYLDGIELVNE